MRDGAAAPLQFPSPSGRGSEGIAPDAVANPMGRLATRQSHDGPGIGLSVVSNSRLLHEGLVVLLKQHIEAYAVGHYPADSIHASSLPARTGHVALIDSGIGRESAIAWTLCWRRLEVPTPVVVLELDDNPETILDCIEAGASGYVLQGAAAAEVAETVSLAHQGKARCSPEVTARLFARLASLKAASPTARQETVPLTPRELEVLHLVARGCTDKEIATQLVVEVRTVKHHMHNILGKLKLRRRWDAARLATERGWFQAHSAPFPLHGRAGHPGRASSLEESPLAS